MKMKKWMWYLWAGLAAMVSLAQPAMATTYYVPDNYATIQAAVDACRGGETIVVRAGTYKGAGNKNIIISRNIDVIAESGPEATIIDCEGSGRGFYFKNVSSLNELEGFQIINGSVTGSGLNGHGGGILLDFASPIIRNCIITGNSASGGGGGICATGSPTLSDCRINNNAAKDGQGGGIYSGVGVLSITNCEINNNTATSHGGGIYSTGSGLLLTGSQINGNSGNYYGGGIYSSGDGTVSITDCQINGNVVSYSGGGIY
jgi:parallel beta-helix repeat protein/predicted outer membrane repeat protein